MHGISQSVRSALRSIMGRFYYFASLHRLARRGQCVILAYHRVLPCDSSPGMFLQPGLYVTDRAFEQHILFLRKHYSIIPIGDLIHGWKTHSLDSHKRYCALTFDDGWSDTYSNAFPIFLRHNVPATVFLPTTYIGTNRRFWTDTFAWLLANVPMNAVRSHLANSVTHVLDGRRPLDSKFFTGDVPRARYEVFVWFKSVVAALMDLPTSAANEVIDEILRRVGQYPPRTRTFLTWDEVRTMSQHGISFGSHTCNHAVLTHLAPDEVRSELVDSHRFLSSQCINYLPVFCYPSGITNQIVRGIAENGPYEAAFSTEPGAEGLVCSDRFRIRRIQVHEDVAQTKTDLAFHLARLSGRART